MTTEDDKLFTPAEIRDSINGITRTKLQEKTGLRAIFSKARSTCFQSLPQPCTTDSCFHRIWKREKIISIVKPGKEASNDISKYHPISLINTIVKVFEKVLINRLMHHIYTNNLMSNNQYGFTQQTSRVDAVIALKDFVQEIINEGQ
jgi:hypothetical protein